MNIETQAVLFALATPVVVFAAILSAKAENKNASGCRRFPNCAGSLKQQSSMRLCCG